MRLKNCARFKTFSSSIQISKIQYKGLESRGQHDLKSFWFWLLLDIPSYPRQSVATNEKSWVIIGLAKIYLSIYNTENKQAVILQMEEEIVRLRQSLAHRIRKHVRRIPEIAFYIDDTLDEMYRVDALFDRLRKENQMGNEDQETAE